jgi:hypothetical protein
MKEFWQPTKYERACEILGDGFEWFIGFSHKFGFSERWWQRVIMGLFLLPEYWLAACFWVGHRILIKYNPKKYGNTDRWLFYERENF